MDFELISITAFFLIVFILLLKYRKNVQFKYGIIVKRWKGGVEVIDSFVSKHRKFLIYFGNFGSFIALLASFVSMYFLITFTLKLQEGFGIILPAVKGVEYPKPFISVPFWYWIVGIFSVVFPHETMHALFSRLEKIKIKDYGIFLFLFFPLGAFVDVDEKRVERLKLLKKLRIYSAGSIGNLLVCLLTTLILILSSILFSLSVESKGVVFERTINNTPAFYSNLSGIITRIDNHSISSVEDLKDFLSNAKPNQTVRIFTSSGNFTLKLSSRPEDPELSLIHI